MTSYRIGTWEMNTEIIFRLNWNFADTNKTLQCAQLLLEIFIVFWNFADTNKTLQCAQLLFDIFIMFWNFADTNRTLQCAQLLLDIFIMFIWPVLSRWRHKASHLPCYKNLNISGTWWEYWFSKNAILPYLESTSK